MLFYWTLLDIINSAAHDNASEWFCSTAAHLFTQSCQSIGGTMYAYGLLIHDIMAACKAYACLLLLGCSYAAVYA